MIPVMSTVPGTWFEDLLSGSALVSINEVTLRWSG